MSTPGDVSAFHTQVRLILESEEFRSSPQLRDFFAFLAEQAFQGRTSVEQIEIAEKVLHKAEDFNPIEDATVRKLASILRRKLEAYYSGSGLADPVIVSLPTRSYVPQFKYREPANSPSAEGRVSLQTGARKRSGYWLLGVAGVLAALFVVYVASRPVERPSGFTLTTIRGNFAAEATDLGAAGIQLGPKVGEYAEVVARMRFTPVAAHHQAGLMIYESPDRYVALSRHFRARPNLEFVAESNARYLLSNAAVEYDPEGGSGEPVWFAIRRNGTAFRAFTSSDGVTWRTFGHELVLADPMPNARLALFAISGKDKSPPVDAHFDQVGAGMSFHHLDPGFLERMKATGWTVESTCAESQLSISTGESSMDVKLDRLAGKGCAWQLQRPAPLGANWRVATKVDFLPAPGSHIALRVGGDQRWFNLERSDLDGGVIRADTSTGGVNATDLPGRPPVYLRIDNSGGQLIANYSRNGVEFLPVDFKMPLSGLIKSPQTAIRVALDPWSKESPAQVARFFYVREEALLLTPYR